MSVSGLTLSLTHRLTRTRSAQAFDVRTISRALVGPPAQSRGLSVQNSVQPIGGRVASPSEMNSARSPACVVGAASRTAPNKAARQPLSSIPWEYHFIGDPSRRMGATFLTKLLRR